MVYKKNRLNILVEIFLPEKKLAKEKNWQKKKLAKEEKKTFQRKNKDHQLLGILGFHTDDI